MAAHPTVKKLMFRIKRSPLRKALPLQYSYALNKLDIFQVPELEIAFIPNPKAANRSIKLAIATRLNPQFRGDPHNANWQYISKRELAKFQGFRFGFVRNPLDRLYSCYQQKIVLYAQTYNQPVLFWRYGDRFTRDMDFAQFVQAVADIPDWYADIHFRSQHTYFYSRDRPLADFVGRFETLAEDWQTVNERCAIGEMPHLNASPREDWKSAFNRELAEMAMQRYRRDIDLFGYAEELERFAAKL